MTISQGPITSAPLSSAETAEAVSPIIDFVEAVSLASDQQVRPYMLACFATLSMASAPISFAAGFSLSSSAGLATNSFFVDQVLALRSKLNASLSAIFNQDVQISLADSIEALDVAVIPYLLTLVSGVSGASAFTADHLQSVILASAANFSADHLHSAEYQVNLAAALTVRDFAAYGYSLDLVEAVDVAGVFLKRLQAINEHISSVDVTASSVIAAEIFIAHQSALVVNDASDTLAQLAFQFESRLQGAAVLKLGDDTYEAVVLAADSVGFTEYQNYPLNSATLFKGKLIGATSNGLYEMEGADDEGVAIDAYFRTKLSSFNQRQLKNVKAVYLGATSTGQLVLKTRVVQDEQVQEHWYLEKVGSSSATATKRFTPGKGLRSSYWQFEVANIEGSDFDVEDVTIAYELLARRIRR